MNRKKTIILDKKPKLNKNAVENHFKMDEVEYEKVFRNQYLLQKDYRKDPK